MTRIGLSMIVKDEAPVVAACLASLVDRVDWWVIVDTGSTDGTQDIVRAALAGVPGELVERPWVDFGHNRDEALRLARASAHAGVDDYVVWIDADETFVDWPDEPLRLGLDGYHVSVVQQGAEYARLALVRLAAPWRWRGVLHERLELEGASVGHLDRPRVDADNDQGARSRDPHTYVRDVEVLRVAAAADPDDPRTSFYLAQSLRDAGRLDEALVEYRRRVGLAGWSEERAVAALRVAGLTEATGRDDDEVVGAFLRAHDAGPHRVEPLVELARLHRERDRFASALLFARAACRLPGPTPDLLFVDRDAWTWRRHDELAVAAYWTGEYAEGLAAAERALALRPDDERLRANVAFCQERVDGATP